MRAVSSAPRLERRLRQVVVLAFVIALVAAVGAGATTTGVRTYSTTPAPALTLAPRLTG